MALTTLCFGLVVALRVALVFGQVGKWGFVVATRGSTSSS
jgi:hypothetical protein